MGGVAKTPPSSPPEPSWFPPDPYQPAVSLLRDLEPPGFPSNRVNMDDPPSWNPVLSSDLRTSATPYSISKTSRHRDGGALPPPPSYRAGEFEAYVGNVEQGKSETEAEQGPLGAVGPYPEPVFRAGELSQYESVFEHGNEERETEGDGFMPRYSFPLQGFWEFAAVFPFAGLGRPSSWGFDPRINRPFLPGRIPGALSHFRSKYETGDNYWDEVGYRRSKG